MRSISIDPFYFLHGVFEYSEINDMPLLLPYEKTRITTLLMSLNRRWDIFTEHDAQTITYCVAAGIPFRGLDPHATLGVVLLGAANWTQPLIASDVCVTGRSSQHRGERTCRWYPSSWDVSCSSVEAARTVLDLIGRAFQNASYEADFGMDGDYESCFKPVEIKCGYDEEVIIMLRLEVHGMSEL